ncbi:MarR family transcriptional regulator [Streptomyces sp. CB00455]|uniref:MarR family transcriptional regulator n=1 Tax=Streptomyces sp. CB00455 TaxID=1703927 RepID=UPI000938F02B|nr:MarR family transcriptional regulator [Streptomyces sp. CB00455]
MPHHAVLCGIAELGPIAQADLSRTVRIDPKDMVTVLNELQARKLISRTRDARDARKNALAPLTPAERRQLSALLARLIVTEQT